MLAMLNDMSKVGGLIPGGKGRRMTARAEKG